MGQQHRTQSADASLQPYREALDDCDARLLMCLRERFSIIRQVGAVKKAAGIPVMQTKRVELIASKVARFAQDNDMPEQLLRSIYDLIIAEACRIEETIIRGD